MRALIKLILCAATFASTTFAQLPPSYDGLTLDFPLPKALSGLGISFSSEDEMRKFNLNFEPVIELISMLEAKGAKIKATPVKIKDLFALDLVIDGKPLKDLVVVNCNSCVIVFEY